MNNNAKITVGVTIAILILLAGVFWRTKIGETTVPSPSPSVNGNANSEPILARETNFQASGILQKDAPGMKADTWYLVFTPQNGQIESLELFFEKESVCIVETVQQACMPALFSPNQTVEVLALKDADVLLVNTLKIFQTTAAPTPIAVPTPNKSDKIRVTSPAANDTIRTPLRVTGEARGTWFFEASFPVRLYDANGKLLATAAAKAQGDWMTDRFVPFSAILAFSLPATSAGTLVLEKDNPSGLPQNSDELRIPVRFDLPLRSVKLYYYDEQKDKDASGNVLCSEKGLVAVERKIPLTKSPIRDTLELLLRGEVTAEEKQSHLSTLFPLSEVKIISAILRDGILTIALEDPAHQTSGGSCRVGILAAQICSTAQQFSTVREVRFDPPELFQP